MTPQEHIDRLDQRCRWLTARIAAKESVGWETVYDRSERDALAWALPRLRQREQGERGAENQGEAQEIPAGRRTSLHDVTGAMTAGCLGGD